MSFDSEAVIVPECAEYTMEVHDVPKNADIILEDSCPTSNFEQKLTDGTKTLDSGEQNDPSTPFSGIALQYFHTQHGHSSSSLDVQDLRRSQYREYSQEQQSDLMGNVMEALHDLTITVRKQGATIAALQRQLHHIQPQQPSNHAIASDVEPEQSVTQPGSSMDAPVNVFAVTQPGSSVDAPVDVSEAVPPVYLTDDDVEPVQRGWQSESSNHAPANGSGPTYPVPPRRAGSSVDLSLIHI